jgi:hypothetical protein
MDDGWQFMTESNWPKADPPTDPKESPSWRLIAEERARQLDRAHELIKIHEARIAHLEKMLQPLSHTVRPEVDLTEDE